MSEMDEKQDLFTPEKRIRFLEELLGCGDQIPLWVYGMDFHLIRTNSEQLVLNTIFERTGCLGYMKEYYEKETAPLILSSYLGLMWCAAGGEIQTDDGIFRQYYVIGPVVNTDLSFDTIRETIQNFNIDVSWRTGFIRLMQSIPVIPSTLFFQYALMLHYCVNGEKLHRSDIAFQISEAPQKTSNRRSQSQKTTADRFLTYRNEQQILDNIRLGNLDYGTALERGHRLSNGLRVSTGDPMQQIILSTVTFTSLCTRAAIEGGLSPDTAYALGDSYIQSLTTCNSFTEARAINHTMYEDFIQRVHKLRTNPGYSKQIQSCIDYIELHLTEKLSIRRLADRVGYTEYYLSHKFKEETGNSISNYIRYARVERAKSLLTTTDLSVGEIAEQLQFCSSSYFSSKFEEITGVLPNQYRNEKQRL